MTYDQLMMIDLPTVIETPRLLLRPPQSGDGESVHRAILDGYEDFIKWLQWPSTPRTREECELDCRRHQATWILRTDMKFLCFDKQSGELLGRFGYPDFQCVWATPLIALSFFIRKSQQRKGYGTEAANALSRYGFRYFHAKKIELKCDIDNIASCSVPEKLGFSEECEQKGIWPKPNDPLATIRTYSCYNESDLSPLDVSMKG